MDKTNIGLLLVNLGSPEAPTAKALKPYLSEFLMDPDVIDIPAILRWLLVHLVIVPTRSKKSAKLYEKVWTTNGSPLLHYSRMFAAALRHELRDRPTLRIELAMRYGNPGIREGLERLRLKELDRLIVFPLYPQYAQSSTLTVQKKVEQVLHQLDISAPRPEWVAPFYSDRGFIEAARTVASGPMESFNPDFSLFSFHGLPERHVKRLHTVCLTHDSCCDRITAENQNCYRAQCFNTARTIAETLKIPREKYSVSFQSRLGRTPWIQPFTDVVIEGLPRRGVQRLAVFCPSFVADCLETLDEIENRERDRYLKAGGKELQLVPSLNDDPVWVRAAAEIVKRALDG